MIISAFGSFLLFGFLDLLFRSWNGPHRWLVLHLIGNLLIAGLTAQNALLGFVDPMKAMNPIDENLPFFVMISMHLYHLMFYETSSNDRFHHIVFVFGLGAMGLVWNWGRIAHTLMFLMCGLPGAIDYFLLLWYPEKEVVLNRNITLYIRSPLVSAALYIVYLNLWTSQVPSVVLILSMVLMIYNTQSHTMNTVLAK